MKRGRPSIYTEELAKLICERVSLCKLGIDKICNLYDDMPHSDTIKQWRLEKPHFSAMYLEAKSLQAQLLVEEIDDLIPIGIQYYTDDKGQQRIDAPSASLVIAKINNRKWTAARLAPKIYGDKTQSEITLKQHESDLKDLK